LLIEELIGSEEHSVRDQVREFAESADILIDEQY
jgi:hypothetical protein